MNDLIKAGTIQHRKSKTLYFNDGNFYMVKFRSINWALFKTKNFDEVLKEFKTDPTVKKRALYAIMKNGEKFGVVLPCIAKTGDREGEMYFLTACGIKSKRNYMIFDINKETAEINDNAIIYFNIKSEVF